MCVCVCVCVCARARARACVRADQCHICINGLNSLRLLFSFFFLLHTILYVNCISRTVFYMCVEYRWCLG